MLYINEDGTIRLTRGDTARLTVSIANDLTNSDYSLNEGDTLTLTVKRTVKDSEICFQKVLTGSNMFTIEPDDTKELPYGKYKYDVQLTTASGDVFTIIEPATFEVLSEVTW